MANRPTAKGIPVLTPRVIRPGTPVVESVYQLTAELGGGPGAPPDALTAAARIVLAWVKRKFPGTMPDPLQGLQGFVNHDIPGQRVDCVWLEQSGEWALRLEQPDTALRDRPAVGGRVWTTDISLAGTGPRARFGIRVLCASLPGCTESFVLTRPRTVVELAEAVGMTSTVRLRGSPWRVGTDMTPDQFQALVVDPGRTLPVVVLTEPDIREKREHHFRDFVLDGAGLAAKLLGYAHVVLLPFREAFDWTGRVGKVWSVFGGAVRVYHPGLDFKRDPLNEHPLTLLERILFWPHTADGTFAEEGFTTFLVGRVQRYMAGRRPTWDRIPFVNELRLKAARAEQERIAKAISTAKDDAETVRRLTEQLQSKQDETGLLTAEVDRLAKDAEVWAALAHQAERDRDLHAEENQRLRSALHVLRTRLQQKSHEDVDAATPIPDTLDEAAEWAETWLIGRAVLLPRAVSGLKDAVYENPKLVYQALLLLAGEYRAMRMASGPDDRKSRQTYEQARDRLHLRDGPSIDEALAGQYGDTYYVYYPVGTEQRQFLDMHLRCGGNTRDPRRCLAIYFFWDDATQQVVVGWLPSHLECGAT